MDPTKNWYVVTGANNGIGRAIARDVAGRGLPVVMACRNLERSEPVRAQIAAETGNPDVLLLPLDLSSGASIRDFVKTLAGRGINVHVLVNNGGVLNPGFCATADGLEETVAVNYLGTFLLSCLLAPSMRPGSRIVNTGSFMRRFGRITDRLLEPDEKRYNLFWDYSNSKRAVILFSAELAERLRPRGIGVYVSDPGIVSTKILKMHRLIDPLTDALLRPFIRTPEQGARTAIYLATGGAEQAPGFYYANGKPIRIAKSLTDPARRERLWKLTAGRVLQPGEDL